ncbi:MAG: hypothetical protein ABJN39_21495 [Sulfitobacter sp.]|jgi:hypothetical protein|uniref:hypothetical protein n=1 Tax=Alphaproteobacteria TaxID=28211 RepID=UPI000C48DB7D|nr:hypothetical protein [Sulfitobacter sp. LC.270.F.C4]MBF53173.1 hypothetical protein [Actibacterium sp.]WOI13624.1 hypothetical protein R1T45_02395 [Sulfitobacter sp. LC.270.F.C4]|tara:strand:- start:49 stop:303 length:255 start_codon:yes stop_codon:yes gene_type:complete
MGTQIVALLIMLPIASVFIYAGIHEYRRYKSDGRSNYGLVYDEETGTTHVTGISDQKDSYNPDDFDPNDYSEPEIRRETVNDKE